MTRFVPLSQAFVHKDHVSIVMEATKNITVLMLMRPILWR